MDAYTFSYSVAVKYGLEESIMIAQFQFWIKKNMANEKHRYEDRTWTYNSIKAFGRIYEFWSVGQIRRILKSIIEKGVIIKGNFNKAGYDRTTWYAFNDEQKWIHLINSETASNTICSNRQMDLLESTNAFVEIDQPIPVINTQLNKENNIKEKPSLEDRKLAFKKSVIKCRSDKYDIELLENFFIYWSEHGENDKKMRFEKEKTFGLKARLHTFYRLREQRNKNSYNRKNDRL